MHFLTKIRLPRRRSDLLRRARLVDYLHQQADKRLILLCAAAGYGKTSLLVDLVHELGLPVCWYSLDASDADPKTFLEYLLLSLRERFPGFGRQTETLLNSVQDIVREIPSLVASLANEMASDIDDYFFVVIDDYHFVDDSDAVNSAIDLLLHHLPDNCHLVISSRTLPRLTFSRLAARRQVSGLGTSDLRFNGEELSKLLRDNYKLSMTASQANQLMDVSEGWITGILLTTQTLWMGLVEGLAKVKGSGSPLFDYLANEAYLQQPAEVQQFLLCSSTLDQMTPKVCDRLFAAGRADEMLLSLSRANLFISQLEGPGEWYRYHNLFQEFLQTKLRAEDLNLYTTLHRRAGEVAESDAAWESALNHYLLAEAREEAACLVERTGEQMMVGGRWATLHRWLDSLPPAEIDARARLSLFRGRTYLWSGETERAVTHLDRAAKRYSELGDREGAGEALSLQGAALRVKGRLAEAFAACSAAVELLGSERTKTAADAHRDRGSVLAALGRPAEATEELRRALSIYESSGDEAGVATISEGMGLLAVRSGDLARGMSDYDRALASWRRSGNLASTAGVLNSIGMVHCYTGEYETAVPILEEALAKSREAGYLRVQAAVLGSLGAVRRDSGILQDSLDSYEAALEVAHQVDEAQLIGILLNGLANTHRLMGDYATSERLLRQALQQAEESQAAHEVAAYSISCAILAEEQDDLDRAEDLLRTAIDPFSASGARRDLARARFHLSRTLFAKGDEEEAASELEKCIELCRELGYDQFMVAEGQRARPLLSWAMARGIGGRRLHLVMQRLQQARPPVAMGKRLKMRVEVSGPRQIEIYSFGGGRVLLDSELVKPGDWAVERTKELFFYLLERSRSLRKEQIIDILWPEAEFGKGNSQFHSTMYRLRRAIFSQCVSFQDGRYQIDLGASSWYDADEFVRLLNDAEASGATRDRRIDGFERALALYRGPYLEEIYSDWVIPRREELEQKYLQTLVRLSRLKAEDGKLAQAVELLRSALKANPFQEDAHYGLIHYPAILGDRTAALRHYKGYVELLRDELGVKPSPKIAALADRVAKGDSLPLH